MEPITIAVTNYNGAATILRTLQSALAMDYPSKRVLVVDDGSTDDGLELVAERYPEVELVRLPANTACLNKVRNAALRASATRLVFLVDNDVTFDSSCLTRLVEAIERLPRAAICIPVVLQDDDRETVYGGGHRLHYLCVSTDEYRDSPSAGMPSEPRVTVGGGIQLIDKEALAEIGFFNEDLVIGWGDDGELHHRVNLCGLACYTVPAAAVYHPRRERAPRTYGQIHNRWLILLQSYARRTLLILLPALLVYEIVLIAFLARQRQLAEYPRALRAVRASRPRWLAERRRIQQLRRSPDREMLVHGPLYVPSLLLRRGWERAALRLLDLFFAAYWKGFAWLL